MLPASPSRRRVLISSSSGGDRQSAAEDGDRVGPADAHPATGLDRLAVSLRHLEQAQSRSRPSPTLSSGWKRTSTGLACRLFLSFVRFRGQQG